MAMLKEVVARNSEVVEGHRLWKGKLLRGRPSAAATDENGKIKHIDIQRYLLIKKYNLNPDKQYSVVTTCGNPRCISTACIEVREKRTPRKKLRKIGRMCGMMVNNKAVLGKSVYLSREGIAQQLGVSVGTITTIQKMPRIMACYFQNRLEEHLTDVSIEEVRSSALPDKTLRKKYNLSKFAMDYIKNGADNPVHDPEVFSKVLNECEVVDDHLVWVGEFSNGYPVTRVMGGQARSAAAVFSFAVLGKNLDSSFRPVCGFENCVNPFCCEEIENEYDESGVLAED